MLRAIMHGEQVILSELPYSRIENGVYFFDKPYLRLSADTSGHEGCLGIFIFPPSGIVRCDFVFLCIASSPEYNDRVSDIYDNYNGDLNIGLYEFKSYKSLEKIETWWNQDFLTIDDMKRRAANYAQLLYNRDLPIERTYPEREKMYYPRSVDRKIRDWWSMNYHKPLLVRGGKFVGKTSSIMHFISSMFSDKEYFTFQARDFQMYLRNFNSNTKLVFIQGMESSPWDYDSIVEVMGIKFPYISIIFESRLDDHQGYRDLEIINMLSMSYAELKPLGISYPVYYQLGGLPRVVRDYLDFGIEIAEYVAVAISDFLYYSDCHELDGFSLNGVFYDPAYLNYMMISLDDYDSRVSDMLLLRDRYINI